ARREGVRRGAAGRRRAARRGLRCAVRRAQGRCAGREEPGRRSQGGLSPGDGEGRQGERRVPRKRAHAARGAGRMRLALAALAAALLAGCNPFAKTGPQPAELEDIPDARQVKLLWSADLGTGEPYILSPALVGDAVYVASRRGNVARLDARTGREVWRTEAASRLAGGVGADARTAVV